MEIRKMDNSQQPVSPNGTAPGSTGPGTPRTIEEDRSCVFNWPTEFMKRQLFKKGEVIFKQGDAADCMFYIKKGKINLVEIDKIIGENEVLGEMGIFSPYNRRTVSAVCVEDLEAYTMGRVDVLQFFQRDPEEGLDLIHLSFKRFIENLKAETEARERIESELRIAQGIQSSMLPKKFPSRTEFEIFAMMDPAKEVGGDFYDFFFVGPDKLCFVIGDVSGKGVPAALFMAITSTLIKNEALSGIPANEIMSRVNNFLYPENEALMFVTVFCVILDIKTGEMQYCNSGHNPPLILRKNGAVDFMKMPSGFVVGVMENSACEKSSYSLAPGDAIFLYTDGVTEAMNPERKLFSDERLKQYLEKVHDKGMEEIIGSVHREIFAYARGAEQSDDITMLALRYKGGATILNTQTKVV